MGRLLAFFPFTALPCDCCRIEQLPGIDLGPIEFRARRSFVVMVQDLESYNGTFVNGKRAVTPLPVQNGDEVTLGPCSFRVSVLNDGGETPASLTEAGTTENRFASLPEGEDESTVNGTGSSFA